MLSQKLAKTALALQTSLSPQARVRRREELSAIVSEWTRAHRGLLHGDTELRLPGETGAEHPEILAAFAKLEPDFLAILSAAKELRPPNDDGQELTPSQHAAIARVMEHEDRFLQQMQALVGLYASNARSHVWQLQSLGWGIVGTILAILVAIQWLVVRPAVASVGLRFATSEAEYRRLVESMSEGLIVHDAVGRIQFANRRFCELVGMSVEELLGLRAAQYVVEVDRSRYFQLLADCTEHSDPVELALVGRGGQRTESMASAQPLFDDHGTQQGFLLVVTDITARKQAERRSRELLDQLAHADRLKSMGELAAGLAHEVNQPLAAIANYASSCLAIVKTDGPPDESIEVPLQRILSAAHRGGEIIRRARRFSQRRPHEVRLESLNDLVRDVEQLCRPEAERREVAIEFHLAVDLPLIPVDGIQVQQILTNLIQNAFVAVDSNSVQDRRIRISTEFTSPEFAKVSVRDNGTGLVGSDAGRVFEPFYSTRSDGLGLGLAIARNIVEAHGGTIEAFNNGDRGATFCFTLSTQPQSVDAILSDVREESVHA
ncbi:MAG: domain S-box protein [Planctomycetaceae bacterium]|nr:domain S-box protein [Planctomycetaceae bacterium]